MNTDTKADDTPADAELIDKIRAVVAGRDVVDLKKDHHLDRIPCTRRKLYALCRAHALAWGYEYKNAEYVASGNRAFQRNHRRGRRVGPHLLKRKVASP
jgi:hypothetical protein